MTEQTPKKNGSRFVNLSSRYGNFSFPRQRYQTVVGGVEQGSDFFIELGLFQKKQKK